MKRVVVYGASGHGKVVADIVLARADMELLGFIDDGADSATTVLGHPVLGPASWLLQRTGDGIGVALGIGDNRVRRMLAQRCVDAGVSLVTAVHPAATVAPSARIDGGAAIMAKAVVNPDAHIGEGAIINTAAVAEHDTVIGEYAHLSPNAALGGGARIGALSHFGVGASALPLVRVGRNTTVGAGAVVHRDLPDDVVAAGVPAQILRQKAET